MSFTRERGKFHLTDWLLCQGMKLTVLCSVAPCIAAAVMLYPTASIRILRSSVPVFVLASFMPSNTLNRAS